MHASSWAVRNPLSSHLVALCDVQQQVWAILIVSDVPYQLSLLATLTISVKFFSSWPVYYQARKHSKLFRDIKVTPLKANIHNRTYLKTVGSHKTVVKFFDSEDGMKEQCAHHGSGWYGGGELLDYKQEGFLHRVQFNQLPFGSSVTYFLCYTVCMSRGTFMGTSDHPI